MNKALALLEQSKLRKPDLDSTDSQRMIDIAKENYERAKAVGANNHLMKELANQFDIKKN